MYLLPILLLLTISTAHTQILQNDTQSNNNVTEILPICNPQTFRDICSQVENGKRWNCHIQIQMPSLDCYFDNLPDVQDLTFVQTKGDVSVLEAFTSLSQLRKLTLYLWQEPVSFKELIEMFPHVTHLSFPGTSVYNFQRINTVSVITSLQKLQLIEATPPFHSLNLPALTHLQVSTNDTLTPNIFNNLSLIELEYHNRAIQSFHWKDFGLNLTSLIRLTLNFPKITNFPTACPFENLKFLKLHGQRAPLEHKIFQGNATLSQLNRLELTSFRLTGPQDFSKLTNLETIFLTDIFGPFYHIQWPTTKFRTLLIERATIPLINSQTFPTTLPITSLVITKCVVKEITQKAFQSLPHLKSLDLSHNGLTRFIIQPHMFPNLTYLRLTNNQILLFPFTSLYLPSLRLLDLSRNRIRTVQTNTVKLPMNITSALKVLNLNSNYATCDCEWVALQSLLPNQTVIFGACNHTVPFNQLTMDLCTKYEITARFSRSLNVSDLSQETISSELFNSRNFHLNLTVERARLLTLTSALRIGTTSNFVRPQIGVGFDKIRHFYPGIEYYYVHMHISWPKLILPKLDPLFNNVFEQVCESPDSLIQAICDDYVPLIKNARAQIINLRDQVLIQFNELISAFVTPESLQKPLQSDETQPRHKRSETNTIPNFHKTTPSTQQTPTTLEPMSILNDSNWNFRHKLSFWFGIFVPPAGVAIHSDLTRTRAQAFKFAMRILFKNQKLMKDAHLDLRQDLTQAFTIVNNMIENSTHNIRELFSLINDTNFEMNNVLNSVQGSFNIFQQKIQAVRILSALGSRYLQLWNSNVLQFEKLLSQITSMISAIHDLQHGKLSPTLVSHTNMQDAIKQATASLQAWHRDYKLVFQTMPHYYSYSNLIFMPMTHGIVLQLMWPITPRNSPRYDLYHVQSVHVPVTTGPTFAKPEANHDYTKISLPYPYLAVADHQNFIELDIDNLNKCLLITDTYYCVQNFLELDQKHLTCLTALYLNATAAQITDLCDIDYLFEPFKPKAEIIDVGNQLLISGLNQPWRYQCIQDRIPKDLLGAPYALIAKDSLCSCSVTSSNGHLARRLMECTHNKQPVLKLTYIPNIMMQSVFPNLTYNPLRMSDIMTTDPPMALPELQTLQRIKNFRLRNNTAGSVKLKHLANLIDQKGKQFEQDWQKISDDIAFTSWFTTTYWPKALAFTGAIAGIMALILSCYLCLTNCYGNGMVKSMMFLTTPRVVQALPIDPQTPVTLSGTSLFHITLTHIFVVMIIFATIYCGKRAVRFCCRQANLLIVHPELRQHPKVEVFLEFHGGEERVLVYLMTIKAPINQLHFSGNITQQHFTIDDHTIYSVLRPNWNSMDCELKVEQLVLELPTMIAVPLNKKRKVHRLLDKPCSCSLIATDSLYLYRLETKPQQMDENKPYAALIKDLRAKQNQFTNFQHNTSLEGRTIAPSSAIDSTAGEPPSAPYSTNTNP